jgi:Bacterial Ig domain
MSGSSVPRATVVRILVNASDVSGVSKVEVYVNGNLKCTDTVAPYSCDWKVPRRSRVVELKAKA